MTWYRDMDTVTLVDEGPHIRAIGWLSATQPFARGTLPATFVARLTVYVQLSSASSDALGWELCFGEHTCELCGKESSSGNVGVPDREFLYVAPEMLAHYVVAHQYRPPNEFLRAVLIAPFPNTAAYAQQVAPFRLLHEQHLNRQQQQQLTNAVRHAATHGGDKNAIRAAANAYYGTTSPDICQRIQHALSMGINKAD